MDSTKPGFHIWSCSCHHIKSQVVHINNSVLLDLDIIGDQAKNQAFILATTVKRHTWEQHLDTYHQHPNIHHSLLLTLHILSRKSFTATFTLSATSPHRPSSSTSNSLHFFNPYFTSFDHFYFQYIYLYIFSYHLSLQQVVLHNFCHYTFTNVLCVPVLSRCSEQQWAGTCGHWGS